MFFVSSLVILQVIVIVIGLARSLVGDFHFFYNIVMISSSKLPVHNL